MIGWRRHRSYQFWILGRTFGALSAQIRFWIKSLYQKTVSESQTILFTPSWYHTKLPKLVLFGVKEAVRLSLEQIILSRASWYDLGELSHVTSTLRCAKVYI